MRWATLQSVLALMVVVLCGSHTRAWSQPDDTRRPSQPPPQAAPSTTPPGGRTSSPSPQPVDPTKPLVPFPHPLITEVLFAVPTGDGGDANKDGTRQVAGDEFVELVNPHAKPISIGGYSISDMTASEKSSTGKPKSGAVKWTFPPLTLKPGQVVVVFNGHASTISGPVGSGSAAPERSNPAFADAVVFSMRQPTDRVAFANTGDWALLTAPGGNPVHLVKWGEPRIKPPANVPLVEDAPTPRSGSVQRIDVGGPLIAHPSDGSVSFSPGTFASPSKPVDNPEPVRSEEPTPQPTPQPSSEPSQVDPIKPTKKPRF